MFTAATKGNEVSEKEHDIVGDVKAGARRVKHDVNSAASAVKEDLQDMAHQAGKYTRSMIDSAGGNVSEKIRDNPIQSGLIALAAGFLLGVLYRR